MTMTYMLCLLTHLLHASLAISVSGSLIQTHSWHSTLLQTNLPLHSEATRSAVSPSGHVSYRAILSLSLTAVMQHKAFSILLCSDTG